jgi:hypothetical protein
MLSANHLHGGICAMRIRYCSRFTFCASHSCMSWWAYWSVTPASSLGCIFAFWCLPCLLLHSISLTWFSCCALFHFTAPHLRVSVPWSRNCICVFASHQLHLQQLGPTCCHYNACCMHCCILCLSHIALPWRWWIPNVNLSAGSYCLHHAMSSMDLLGLRLLSHGELCLLFYSSDLLMCIATVCVHLQDVWGAISHMSVCLAYMRGRHWVFIHVAHIMFWVFFDDGILTTQSSRDGCSYKESSLFMRTK